MESNLIVQQNTDLVLKKSKSLVGITNKILNNSLVQSFSFVPFCTEHENEDIVNSISITSDGKYIVSSSENHTSKNNTIKIWNIQTGERLRTLARLANRVNAISVTPDGNYIVSGSGNIAPQPTAMNVDTATDRDNGIQIRNFQTGEYLNTLEGYKSCVNSILVTPDKKYIISGNGNIMGGGNTIKIWNFQTGECLKTLEGHKSCVNSISVTHNDKYIVSGSGTYSPFFDFDKTIKIWNFQTGECLKTLEGHESCISSILVTPDDRHIVSGSVDKTIKIWNFQMGECIKTLEGHEDGVNSISITPDGKHIVSGSVDKTVKIWNFQTGECLKTLEGHENCVKSVSITPDGNYIVSGGYDDTIKIWNFQTGECIYTIDNSYQLAIDKNGYFTATDEVIEKYIRVNEAPLTQRKLTDEEIKHFRKKDDFLKIDEISDKPQKQTAEATSDVADFLSIANNYRSY